MYTCSYIEHYDNVSHYGFNAKEKKTNKFISINSTRENLA